MSANPIVTSDTALPDKGLLKQEDAKGKIEAWRRYYNEERPHSAQGWMTPAEFAEQYRNEAFEEVSQEPEISS